MIGYNSAEYIRTDQRDFSRHVITSNEWYASWTMMKSLNYIISSLKHYTVAKCR